MQLSVVIRARCDNPEILWWGWETGETDYVVQESEILQQSPPRSDTSHCHTLHYQVQIYLLRDRPGKLLETNFKISKFFINHRKFSLTVKISFCFYQLCVVRQSL